MNVRGQANFAIEEFDASGLNVHQHDGEEAESLVVLIHGLAGHPYRTWGDVPSRIFEAEDSLVDVAIFRYRSGIRDALTRRGWRKGISRLVAGIRELADDYEHIFLVGHSLGGIVAEHAACEYLTASANQDVLPEDIRLAGLVFVASPRAGTGWVPRPFARVLQGLSLLSPNHEERSKVESYFSTYVERENLAASSKRFVLPAYVALADHDRFVAEFSSAHGVPEPQRRHFEGTHKSIVKPSSSDHALVGWLQNRVLNMRIAVREQARRASRHRSAHLAMPRGAPRRVITDFATDPYGAAWESVFREVCAGVMASGVAVVSSNSAGRPADLKILAHDASAVVGHAPLVKQSVDEVRAYRTVHPMTAAGVSPVGEGSDEAKQVVLSWIEQDGPAHPDSPFYIEGAPDSEGLADVLGRWIHLTDRRINDPSPIDGNDYSASHPSLPHVSRGIGD